MKDGQIAEKGSVEKLTRDGTEHTHGSVSTKEADSVVRMPPSHTCRSPAKQRPGGWAERGKGSWHAAPGAAEGRGPERQVRGAEARAPWRGL